MGHQQLWRLWGLYFMHHALIVLLLSNSESSIFHSAAIPSETKGLLLVLYHQTLSRGHQPQPYSYDRGYGGGQWL